ncbi:MAG: hypothetical protein ACJ71Z_09115 [Aeromicrobium sp.]
MIGIWAEHARSFLLIFGIVAGLTFSLPIFLAPITWAKAFRWDIPDNTDLAVYFGRCLGAVIVAVNVFVIRAGITGQGVDWLLPLLILIFAGMTIVHVWGAIQRIQPMTETIEIAFWLGLLVLGLMFCPA